jgi:hypothetical protein
MRSDRYKSGANFDEDLLSAPLLLFGTWKVNKPLLTIEPIIGLHTYALMLTLHFKS